MTGGTRLARVRAVRLAAIDVGSNSVHVVVADVSADGRVEVVDRVKEMVRLGRHTFTTGRLPSAAMDLAVGAVKTFARLAHARRVVRMRAVATSAVREARNGMAFVRRLRRETGLPVKVITGAEEARLIFRAAQHALGLRGGPHLLLDVGGGSVELVLVQQGRPLWLRSLPLGAARLAERFLISDPPTNRQIQRLEKHLARELGSLLTSARHAGVARVIGTSGTVNTLVAMAAAARELLNHAALLHDIGHAIDHNRHHHHSCYLIRNMELIAFDPLEIEIMAQVARGHRKQVPKLADPELQALPRAARRVVRGLAALLRTADALDRTHFGAVRRLRVALSAAHLVIGVEADAEEAELELWAAERRADLLARLLERPVVLRRARRGAAALPHLRASGAS